MRVIIAGPRNTRVRTPDVLAALRACGFTDVTEIVSGGAEGVDSVGEDVANLTKKLLTIMPVINWEWEWRGKMAGPLRNARMAAYADALLVVRDRESRGTNSMIREARKAGIPVYIHEKGSTP